MTHLVTTVALRFYVLSVDGGLTACIIPSTVTAPPTISSTAGVASQLSVIGPVRRDQSFLIDISGLVTVLELHEA